MTTKTLYLFRHGETDWNVQRRLQGRTAHVPLNALGVRQAHNVAQNLKDKNIRAIYSSPLLRAQQTATIVAEHCGAVVTYVTELQERSFGKLEGLSRDEIDHAYPEVGEILRSGKGFDFDTINTSEYQIETVAASLDRFRNAVQGIAQNRNEVTLAISTHGAVIYNFLREIKSDHGSNHVGNGEVLVFEYTLADDAFRLIERLSAPHYSGNP